MNGNKIWLPFIPEIFVFRYDENLERWKLFCHFPTREMQNGDVTSPYNILTRNIIYYLQSTIFRYLTISVSQFLHIFWFSLIVRVVMKFAKNEQPEGDLRSEEEVRIRIIRIRDII